MFYCSMLLNSVQGAAWVTYLSQKCVKCLSERHSHYRQKERDLQRERGARTQRERETAQERPKETYTERDIHAHTQRERQDTEPAGECVSVAITRLLPLILRDEGEVVFISDFMVQGKDCNRSVGVSEVIYFHLDISYLLLTAL